MKSSIEDGSLSTLAYPRLIPRLSLRSLPRVIAKLLVVSSML
jgi:hypothetical protein